MKQPPTYDALSADFRKQGVVDASRWRSSMATETEGQLTITIPRRDMNRIMGAVRYQRGLHQRSCPHFTSWAGVCNCWIADIRKTLEASKP